LVKSARLSSYYYCYYYRICKVHKFKQARVTGDEDDDDDDTAVICLVSFEHFVTDSIAL